MYAKMVVYFSDQMVISSKSRLSWQIEDPGELFTKPVMTLAEAARLVEMRSEYLVRRIAGPWLASPNSRKIRGILSHQGRGATCVGRQVMARTQYLQWGKCPAYDEICKKSSGIFPSSAICLRPRNRRRRLLRGCIFVNYSFRGQGFCSCQFSHLKIRYLQFFSFTKFLSNLIFIFYFRIKSEIGGFLK